MLRHLLIILSFLSGGLILNAQEPAINYVLQNPIPGNETRDYVARNFVSIIQGYSYTPETGNHLLAKTDPLMIFPPDDGETGGPNPGDDGVVGAIPGSFGISPMGTSTYSIAIEAPPGISGMTPEISINYNSSGGDGIMGLGWTIGGISAVTNVRPTQYYSDYWLTDDEDSFFNDNNFALDGQRLIPQEGDNLDWQNAEYRLEINDFTRIKKRVWGSVGGTGGIYFTAEKKGGLIYEYGYSNDSRQWVETEFFLPHKSVLNYMVDKISDRFGNKIEYQYTRNTNTGEIYISKIEYGEGGEIIFNYEDRTNKIVTRMQHKGLDVKFQVAKRLTSIVTKYNGQIYRKYVINYISRGTNNNKYVESITLEGTNGDKYNNTLFEWSDIPSQDYNYNRLDDTFLFGSDTGGEPVSGDFNGDGLLDICIVVTNDYNRKNDIIIYKNYGNGVFYRELTIDGHVSHYNEKAFVGDYNGDGISDLIIGFNEDLQDNYIGNLFLFKKDFTYNAYWNELNMNSGSYIYTVADMDSDGLTDVITGNQDGSYGCSQYGNSSLTEPFVYKYSFSVHDDSFSHNSRFYFADFNGNGRTDALQIASVEVITKSKLYINEVTGFGEPIPFNQSELPIEDDDKILIGDFNKDLIADLCVVENGETIDIYQGYGGGFIKTVDSKFVDDNIDDQNDWQLNLFIGDFNGDGNSDLYRNYTVYNSIYRSTKTKHTILISNSEGTNLTEIDGINDTFTNDHLGEPTLIFDVNSDGVSDIFYNKFWYFKPDAWWTVDYIDDFQIYYLDEQFNNIVSISDGLGVKTNLVYKHLTGDIRKGSSDAEFPVAYYPGVLTVLDNVYINDDNFYSKTNYTYEGARVHIGGKGFLGFLKTTTSKWLNTDVYTFAQTENSINTEYYYMWPKTMNTWAEVNGTRIDLSEVTNLYNTKTYYKTDGSKLRNYYPYLSKTITKEYDLNGVFIKTSRVDNNFNEWGDLTSSHTMTDNNPGLSLSSPETSFDYRLINTNIYLPVDEDMLENWVLGRLTTAYVMKIAPGEGDISRTSTFSYYDLNSGTDKYGLLKTETSQPWDDDWLKKEYFYDEYGNLIRTETTGSDIKKRIYQTVYDDNNRFIKNSINPLGHYDTKLYDDLTGNVKEKTDPNGLTISYKFDGFGGLTESTNPDKTKTISVLRWVTKNDSDAPEVSAGDPVPLYYAWAKSSGGPLKKIYYDKYGRELRRVSVGFGNKTIYSDTKYNINNTVLSTTQPYFKGDNPPVSMLTFYTYDELLRPLTVTEPGNRITTTNYNGLAQILTNPEGQSNTKTYNVAGLLVSSTDASNQSVTYTYNSDGNLKNIIDPDGNTTELRYDKFGNRTYLDDPDLGISSYDYNVDGNLLSINKANGTTAVFTYDLLGRMKTRTEDEGFTEWFYDEGENGLGKISHVEGPGVAEKYYYDALGRLFQKDEVINGEMFSTNNTYDIFGRAKTFEYPSGFITKNIYDNNSYLKAIEQADNGKILWQVKDLNAKGQINHLELGNGLSSYYDYYDETGLIKEIETPGIQDMYYTWYDIANLESRENLLISGLKETFLYDDLNRLTTVSLNNNTTQFMQYDDIGNILSKSDVGTYNYDNPQPHAVSSIDGNHIPISSLLQDIQYTSFDKVKNITEGQNRLNIQYGISHERKMMVQTSPDGTSKTKYYIGGGIYERVNEDNSEKLVHYLSAGDGLFAIYTLDKKWDNSTEGEVSKISHEDYNSSIEYVLKDHLGSIQYLTDFEGNLIEEYSYDAWGKRRDPLTWEDFSTTPTIQVDRGYTGHEHLDLFELVNMNGRIYDPVIGRFLSADPYMQMPEHTQGLNRYSYCFNNPLSHTDPSGFSVDDAIFPMWAAVVVGTIVTVATAGLGAPAAVALVGFAAAFTSSALSAAMNGASFGQAMLAGMKGGIMGAAMAYASFGIGEVFNGVNVMISKDISQNFFSNLIKAGTHAGVSGGFRLAQGGRFESGFMAGLFSSLSGFGVSLLNSGSIGLYAIVGAAIGGTAEVIGGGKFANGAITGAFVGMFNEAMHSPQRPKKIDWEDKKSVYNGVIEWARYIESGGKPYGRDYYHLSEIFNNTTPTNSDFLGFGSMLGAASDEINYTNGVKIRLNETRLSEGIDGLYVAGFSSNDPTKSGSGDFRIWAYNPEGSNNTSILTITFINKKTYDNWYNYIWPKN